MSSQLSPNTITRLSHNSICHGVVGANMAVIGCSSQHIRRYFSCSRLSAVQVEVYVLRELFQIQKCRCSDVALRAIGARSRSGSPVLARSVTGDQAFEFEVSAERTRSAGLACDKWLHVAAAPSHFEPLQATTEPRRIANRDRVAFIGVTQTEVPFCGNCTVAPVISSRNPRSFQKKKKKRLEPL